MTNEEYNAALSRIVDIGIENAFEKRKVQMPIEFDLFRCNLEGVRVKEEIIEIVDSVLDEFDSMRDYNIIEYFRQSSNERIHAGTPEPIFDIILELFSSDLDFVSDIWSVWSDRRLNMCTLLGTVSYEDLHNCDTANLPAQSRLNRGWWSDWPRSSIWRYIIVTMVSFLFIISTVRVAVWIFSESR